MYKHLRSFTTTSSPQRMLGNFYSEYLTGLDKYIKWFTMKTFGTDSIGTGGMDEGSFIVSSSVTPAGLVASETMTTQSARPDEPLSLVRLDDAGYGQAGGENEADMLGTMMDAVIEEMEPHVAQTLLAKFDVHVLQDAVRDSLVDAQLPLAPGNAEKIQTCIRRVLTAMLLRGSVRKSRAALARRRRVTV